MCFLVYLQPMKKNIIPVIVGAGALAAFFIYRNYQNFTKTFTAEIGRVRFNPKQTQGALFTSVFFDIDLIIKNPSAFTGIIKAVKLDIILSGRVLGTVNQVSAVTLPKEASTVLPVTVGVNTLSLFPNISDAIKSISAGKPLSFQIVGTILTNYGTININNVANVR